MSDVGSARGAGLWDPGQYARFGDHRLRPALELMARIDHPSPRLAVDLGCGAGEIATLMADRWPEARIVGLDSSAEMLARVAASPGRVEWLQADVRDWEPDSPPDILYSNAVLQWVDGHDRILPRLFDMVAPGGVFAVQMPMSWPEPSHQALRQTLADLNVGSAELRASVDRRWVLDADFYYDLLRPHAGSLDVWETRYHQVLQGDDPVLEWVKGTALRPVLSDLKQADRDRFMEAYRERLAQLYVRRPGGETLFPFPRLFIIARRSPP